MLNQTHRQRHSTRRVASLAITLLASVALLGCGGDDDSSSGEEDATTTTEAVSEAAVTIGKDAETDLGVTEDEGLCFGTSLVDQLGEESALELNDSDADLTELPAEQVSAVQVAFNECVPGSALAQDIVDEFYSSIGTSAEADPAVVDCVATSLDGKTGDVALEGISAQSDDSAANLDVTAGILEGCVPQEVLTELLATSFVSAGLTEAQAQCASEQLAGQITLTQFMELGSSTAEVPPELQSIADAAVTACANAG